MIVTLRAGSGEPSAVEGTMKWRYVCGSDRYVCSQPEAEVVSRRQQGRFLG
jgi:hypothetical protein